MKNYEIIKKNLEERKDRSAWNKGVTVYALELLDEVEESGKEPETGAELKALALNGASDWNQYSWGGSSLIYDKDIAQRLCTPSELKKTRDGEKRPNSYEEWLDVQARALKQAFSRLLTVWTEAKL